MPITRQTKNRNANKNSQPLSNNKRNNNNTNENTSSSSSQQNSPTKQTEQPKKIKLSSDNSSQNEETPLEQTINNIITENDSFIPLSIDSTLEHTTPEVMDIDSTSTEMNDNETYSSPAKDTTNDSMHASSSNHHNNNNDVLHPI